MPEIKGLMSVFVLIKWLFTFLGGIMILFILGFPFGLMQAIRQAEIRGQPFPIKAMVIYVSSFFLFGLFWSGAKFLEKKIRLMKKN